MAVHDIPKLDRKGLREFGLTTGAIFAGLFGFLLPLIFRHWPPPAWPWVVATVLCAWALLSPSTLNPVYRTWMRIGLVLAWINTRIILGVMFYVMIAPMGAIKRLFGSDAMRRHFDPDESTYRVPSKPRTKMSMERPY